jgi:phosphoenolpyruvate-protein kinase (PTS system EI component)
MIAQMARTPRDVPVEPMEVVLIAQDYEAAASLAVPWARTVGIIAERALPDAVRLGVPSVIGVEGVLDKITDETLVLIDGDRGVVLVDPDPTAVATYQAERERISPRRRLYLDYEHQPARTLDGREVRVTACVGSLEEAREAVEGGADALLVPPGTLLLDLDATDEEQLESLLALADAAGGKPITIVGDAQAISMPSLLRAALRAEFTLALPFSVGAEGYEELQAYLDQVREELLAEETDFGDFHIACAVSLLEPLTGGLADFMTGRVVVLADQVAEAGRAEVLAWLDNLIVAANCLLLPVDVEISGADADLLPAALGLGAAGFLVPSAQAQAVKQAIRTLDVNECRAEVLGGHSHPAD